MAEPFKRLINADLVRQAAARLADAGPGFDAPLFVRRALPGLDDLELKARAMQLADALEAALPADFGDAVALIEASLAPPGCTQGLDQGLAGWILWPVGEFIARRGQGEPGRALQALHAITQRFTAEFAIRPFIERHPRLVFDTFALWTRDPSPHVRRLVSEGSRPRLPWGMRLAALVADPSPTLPLLAALQDDDSEYVRRSVANHLNDIAKDHPGLVAAWLERHLPDASAGRRRLLRHASRTLIKAGDRRVLAAWGLDRRFSGEVGAGLAPRRVRVGEVLQLTLTLRAHARRTQRLVIDYVVHHLKADGRLSPKVFKGWTIELAPAETRALQRRHSLREVTVRRYHPGGHELEWRINGRTVARESFELLAAAAR